LDRAVHMSALEGQLENDIALVSFTDTGTGTYGVSIDWGDGTPVDTSSGHVVASGTTQTVLGSHTYTDVGAHAVHAVVTNGSSSLNLEAEVDVPDAPITATAQTISGSTYSQLNNVTVASFTDANTSSLAGD